MKTRIWQRGAIIAAISIAGVLLAACSVDVPTFQPLGLTALQTTSTPAPTATPLPSPTPRVPAGDVIPLKSLADVQSLSATVNIGVNGTLNGKLAQGNMTAVLTTNDQKQSQIVVTGPLLGDVVAQIGGAAVSLFAPRQVTVYKVPEGTYAVVQGLFDVCVKPSDTKAMEGINLLSPQSLMSTLTSSDVARGKFVGEETLNGQKVKHYVISGDAFLAAAQKSADPTVKTFGQSLWKASDADVYISSESGYPVAFRGNYSGLFDPLKFEGDFSVDIKLNSINANAPIVLPTSCNNPISQ